MLVPQITLLYYRTFLLIVNGLAIPDLREELSVTSLPFYSGDLVNIKQAPKVGYFSMIPALLEKRPPLPKGFFAKGSGSTQNCLDLKNPFWKTRVICKAKGST